MLMRLLFGCLPRFKGINCYCPEQTKQSVISCYMEKDRIFNLQTSTRQIDSNSNLGDTQINQKYLYWVILQDKK